MATMLAQRVRLTVMAALATVVGLSCGGDSDVGTGPIPVANVEISPPEATIAPTGTVQLAATPKDAAGTTLADRSVTWSTSDAAVATVSEAGLVTGVAEGAAVITAVSESKSGTAAITVQTPIASVEVIPGSATILNAENLQLAATVKDGAGNPLSNRAVTWSSDAAAVATVNFSGIVTGMGPGTATITASAEEKSATATITVTVLDIGGEWTFSETLSDPAIALVCTNTATFALTQAGITFSGTSDQTGNCSEQGEPIDNSGTFEITLGTVQSTTIKFTEPGDVTCVYQGSLVENPPTGASGTVTCTGVLGLFGPTINATGTWQMTRQELPECSGPVALTVIASTVPTFSWTPRCRLAHVLVEPAESGSDLWSILSLGQNALAPPVTYGEVPIGAEERQAPAPLQSGVTYKVIVFRWIGPGDDDGENIGVKTFTP